MHSQYGVVQQADVITSSVVIILFTILCRMLSTYHLTEEDARNSSDHLLPPESSLPGMAAPGLPAVTNRLPIVELMKVLDDIYLLSLWGGFNVLTLSVDAFHSSLDYLIMNIWVIAAYECVGSDSQEFLSCILTITDLIS